MKLIQSPPTLSQKLTLTNVMLTAFALIAALTVSLSFSIRILESRLEDNLRNIGEVLSNNPSIKDAMERGAVDAELMKDLDTILKSSTDIDIITLARMDGIRLYHRDHEKIGLHFVGGDEGQVLKGQRYFSEAIGTLGFQKRYFVPIFGRDGRQRGFIITSTLISRIDSLRQKIIISYMEIAAILFGIGILTSLVLSRSIKKTLLGYEPTQMAQIFLQRGEVLDSLEEGVLAVNREGSIILVNASASKMLGLDTHNLLGRHISEVFPQMKLMDIVAAGVSENNRTLIQGDNTIILDRIPIIDRGRTIGAAALLRSRTEATRMAEQLTGANHLNSALRANTHEFMNKLHVILGLIEMGHTQEAARYITGISQEQTELISPIVQRIENPTCAALLLGKISRCKELDIAFHIGQSSRLPRRSEFLSTHSLVTILGNLVENAIESINAKEKTDESREINLLLYEDERCLMITVDDTGEGMTAEEIAKLRTPHYSTRGTGRGTGMSLMNGILENCGGKMQIDSEKGIGTSISVTVTQKRPLKRLEGDSE